jgi:signal transduction histidine kinase
MLDKLVANAIEFGSHGAIDIGLVRAGDEFFLTVGNVGPPLPEAPAGHLFDSMVSMRTGPDAAEPHLGLGLYIVKLIAQFHGGSAQAANRGDGRGVVITVAIPAAS